ncbi:twister [Holotrichia oblita]|uniref:Twister n=1 Tax=Holotrichia oblita TaxID=644536 RepID=A0ACB9TBM8_HOLOL|nr:twister [Holotrichia oblita]
MSMFDNNDILKIAELFKPPQQDENSDDEDIIGRPTVKDLGPQDLNVKTSVEDEKPNRKEADDEDLDPEEAASRYLDDENAEASDWRKIPQWDVSYRQQVTPSDVFLGMGGKTPGTASCENMIITVNLPGEKRQNVDLKITCERLELVSPRFRLNIPLPHPVDPQKGNAQFDTAQEKLVITLVLRREFDYINF